MLSKRKGTLHMALMSTCLVVASAHAFEGDPQRGRVVGDTCLGCHAIASYSNVYPYYHVPKIGGQNEAYIVSALLAYRNGDRAHGTMHNNALGLSDQDIADIAAYFSSVGK